MNVAFNSPGISQILRFAKNKNKKQKKKTKRVEPLRRQVNHEMRDFLRQDEIRFGELYGFDIIL